MLHRSLESLASVLFHLKAVQFGAFRLKLHETQPDAPLSPIFFNLRTADNPKPGPLQDYDTLRIAGAFCTLIAQDSIEYDGVCAIPNAATPFLTGLQVIARGTLQAVELIKKEEGGRRWIDHVANKGGLHRGARVLLIDDVVTGADTKLEAITALRSAGFTVAHLIVVVDRQQGGTKIVEEMGVKVHSIFTLTDLLYFYASKAWISTSKLDEVRAYLGITS